MAHILYRGGAGRGDNTSEFARPEDFRPDDLYGESDAQGVDAARFDGARLEAARFSDAQFDDTQFEDGPDAHPYGDQFGRGVAPQAGRQAARGRMNYAPGQHPAVHQSLMQAVRDENPAVQHFIDLQRAAEARAAELAAQLAAHQLEAEQRAAQANARAAATAAAAEARAHVAQDGHGWILPAEDQADYDDPRVQAAAEKAAQKAAVRATNARHAAVRAQQAGGFDPRAALAAWMPSGGMPWLMRRGAGLASVVMALGLGIWSYQLAQRDIAGLQIIKAPEGPSREAPVDPGGELARHTGLSVNSVAAIGTAAPLAEKVTLAPRVAELDALDAPMSELKPLRVPQKAEVPTAQPALKTGERIYEAAMPIPDASFNMAGQPGVEAASRAAPPISEDLTPSESEDVMSAGIDAALSEALPDAAPISAPKMLDGVVLIAASVPGLSTSPRPIARPNSDLQAEAAAVAVADALAPQTPDAIEISPDDLASGTRLVQIGAHDSVEQARAEWDRVLVQFASLMEGKRRVIQEAVSGGRTFYRLRVEGFDDVTEARHFCAALVAERTNCIPAQVR